MKETSNCTTQWDICLVWSRNNWNILNWNVVAFNKCSQCPCNAANGKFLCDWTSLYQNLPEKYYANIFSLLIPPLLADQLTPKLYPTDSIPRSRHCRSRVRQLSPMGEKQTTQPTCCAANHGMRSKTQVTKYTTYNQRHCKPRILYKYVRTYRTYKCEIWNEHTWAIWLEGCDCIMYPAHSDLSWTWQIDVVWLRKWRFRKARWDVEERGERRKKTQNYCRSQHYLQLAVRKHPMLQSGRHRSTSFDEESKELCECSILRSFMVIGWIT